MYLLCGCWIESETGSGGGEEGVSIAPVSGLLNFSGNYFFTIVDTSGY